VRRFVNAKQPARSVFVRGTTEGINLVANTWVRPSFGPGDEILITEPSIIPTSCPGRCCATASARKLVVAPIDDTVGLDMAAFERLLTPRTKLVACPHIANSTGTLLPVEAITRLAHAKGAKVLIDGAQAAPRMVVDVQRSAATSMRSPATRATAPSASERSTASASCSTPCRPGRGGGDMILTVTFDTTTYNEVPHKFEAGTPDISGAIGLGMAVDYLEGSASTDPGAREALSGYGAICSRRCRACASSAPGSAGSASSP